MTIFTLPVTELIVPLPTAAARSPLQNVYCLDARATAYYRTEKFESQQIVMNYRTRLAESCRRWSLDHLQQDYW